MSTNTQIYLASDHAGYELKEKVKTYLIEKGYPVFDCGNTNYLEGDDYTDYMHLAAQKLQQDIQKNLETNLETNTKNTSRAIVFGGSAEGEAIVMNRYSGIRCTTYYGLNLDIVKLGREHNDANAIAFGARFVEDQECLRAVDMFLDTPFSMDPRHIRRITKIEI